MSLFYYQNYLQGVYTVTDHQDIVQKVILLSLLLVVYIMGEFKESL